MYTLIPVSNVAVAPSDSTSSWLQGPRLAQSLERPQSHWWTNLRTLVFSGRAPRRFEEGEHFRGCYLRRRTPAGSLAWSVLWHIVFAALVIQFGRFIWRLPQTNAFQDVRIVWQGAAQDLPQLTPVAPEKKPQPVARQAVQTQMPQPEDPVPESHAFHPTQTIVSAPKVVTHPEQTLIRPDVPQIAPKILPPLPNIVEDEAQPERPKLQITQDELARMKPKQPVTRQEANAAMPELPNSQTQPADVNFAAPAMADPKNPLFLNSGSSGVRAPKQRTVQTSGGPEPPQIAGTSTHNQQLIALSNTPAPAAPEAPVPAGNLSSNVNISPAGEHSSSGGATTKPGGSGTGPNGVSITGGQPRGTSGMSGLGAAGNTPHNLHVAPGEHASTVPKSAPVETPLAGRIGPGSPPEHLFGSRRVYTLHVSMPNVNSASGSWSMSFAEMDDSPNSLHPPRSGEMALPVPLRKEDPPYPPELVEQRVEGEVVLYAIIREDGSVDSIQLLRGLDPTLDKNSMDALSHWKFTPATHGGEKVAVEAIIHVPFKAAPRNQ